MADQQSLFDRIRWRDPLSGKPLEPIVLARTPAGVPICGALRVAGTQTGYPIVDCIARTTPEMAEKHRQWLAMVDLTPPDASTSKRTFQPEITVGSFGFQWNWNANPRSDVDLRHRVADKFHFPLDQFAGKFTLDAGAGAGDQTKYMLEQGAAVVSADLSAAIEVVARKHRLNPNWFGIQADITNLPFADQQFELVYCEGVIQHTRDSFAAVTELRRVMQVGGRIHATHYVLMPPAGILRRIRRRAAQGFYDWLRRHFSSMETFKLLLLTGNLSALSYVPVIGWFIRRSGLALQSPFMDDLLTTWTCTYDLWGSHAFQRYVTPDEFWKYFEAAGSIEPLTIEPGVVVGRRTA